MPVDLNELFFSWQNAFAYILGFLGVATGWLFSMWIVGWFDYIISFLILMIKRSCGISDTKITFWASLTYSLEGYGFAAIIILRILVTVAFTYYEFYLLKIDIETWIYSIFTFGIAAFGFQLPIQQIICGLANGLNSGSFCGRYIEINGKLCIIERYAFTYVVLLVTSDRKQFQRIYMPHTIFFSSTIVAHDSKPAQPPKSAMESITTKASTSTPIFSSLVADEDE
jgi:hypothetical protein